MSPNKFIELAYRTAPSAYPHFSSNRVNSEIFHAWIGVTTEAGESGDVVKKALIYGKEIDLINLDEEFGDKLWYIALYCKVRGITFEDLFEMTIAKLQKRFPEKFTPEEAIDRDVAAEREVLESQALQLAITRDYIRLTGRTPSPGDTHTHNNATYRYTLSVVNDEKEWRRVS